MAFLTSPRAEGEESEAEEESGDGDGDESNDWNLLQIQMKG